MNSKHFKISLTGNAYLGRLAMPRAYSPTMKLACCETQLDRWTDYGRMRWHKPRCWRIFLRSLAPKPPCTNRGVSHRNHYEILCPLCGEPSGLITESPMLSDALCEDCWNGTFDEWGQSEGEKSEWPDEIPF